MGMEIVTWTELAMIGIAISYLLSVLVYMLSYIFTSEVMRAWAKGEVQVAFLTLILFASLISISSIGFVREYMGAAQDYLKGLYKDSIACQSTVIEGSNMLSLVASFTLNINPTIFSMRGTPEGTTQQPTDSSVKDASQKSGGNRESKKGGESMWGAGISLAPFIQPVLMSMSSIHSYFFIPLGMLQLHIRLIDFVVEKGISFLMPLGIFLRAFKFSRNAGNLLIALFISLYFILPAMYLFSKGVMVETMGWKENVCGDMSGYGMMFDFAGPLLNKLAGISMVQEEIGMSTEASDWMEENLGTGWRDSITSKLLLPPGMISYGGSAVSKIFLRVGMESMFLPMLSIIISLGTAREIAAALGSDIDFSQLVRLV